jgi:dephospho-CoA kinase
LTRRVALTGNIASGKTAVAEEWAALGAHVIDADVLARRAVEPGTPVLREIARRFGSGVIKDGALDRAALREVVFADAERRTELESIVHPEVERLRTEAEAAAVARGASTVVHVIPLLFETGLADRFATVVVVHAPEAERLRRLVVTRGLTESAARAMLDAQQPAEAKLAAADHVIHNDGSLADLKREARALWQRIEGGAA